MYVDVVKEFTEIAMVSIWNHYKAKLKCKGSIQYKTFASQKI